MSRQDANQDWQRRREQLDKSLRIEQERIELLVQTLAEQLEVSVLTRAAFFGKVTVTTIVRDGAACGIDWSIEGTVRR